MKTSISTTAANQFAKTASERQQLSCKVIKGFHLLRLKCVSSWRYRYTDAAGKRKTLTIGEYPALKPQEAAQIALEWRVGITKGEADPIAKRQAIAAQKRAQEQLQAQRENLKLGRFFEHYSKVLKDSPDVLGKISLAFSFLFERDMDMITPHDIDKWYQEKREAGLKRSTLVGYFGALKAMLNYAAGTKKGQSNHEPVLTVNPLAGYTLPQLTKEERKALRQEDNKMMAMRDIFSPEVKAAILKGLDSYAEELRAKRRRSLRLAKNQHLPSLDDVAFPHWFIPFTQIAMMTGMRPGDIYALRWENLDHNPFNGKYTLIYTPKKTEHKGDDPIKVIFNLGTQHPLIDTLTTWRKQQGNPKTGLIFPSERVSGEMDRKAHLKHWKHVKELGGVPDGLQFYSFRHNFISDLVRKGKSPELIRKLVGHADTSMITKNYMRTDDHDMEALTALAADSWGNHTTSPAKAVGGE
ncbi:Site-specific recombinase XerD [Pseudidiomarina indica]|uniref:Site-specific recombinase XerD n=1 Tax=Pseudidiomarina indica TaxID=1159017 RepID=A0A1G6A2S4_9GAMM|nr:tyrosine-type recombinase/integrase [Pseudidiomarina indica]SDB02744.1 Site-specific recombinase XerD [Pseudidiomarina indica]